MYSLRLKSWTRWFSSNRWATTRTDASRRERTRIQFCFAFAHYLSSDPFSSGLASTSWRAESGRVPPVTLCELPIMLCISRISHVVHWAPFCRARARGILAGSQRAFTNSVWSMSRNAPSSEMTDTSLPCAKSAVGSTGTLDAGASTGTVSLCPEGTATFMSHAVTLTILLPLVDATILH